MATKNSYAVTQALKNYPQLKVQLAYSQDGTRVNYVFHNNNVYSIARMSSNEIMEFFKDLACTGACDWADKPRRMKAELKSFLETIGEYNNVMKAVQEQAREQAIKVEQAKSWHDCSEKAIDKAVESATIDTLEIGLEMRKPRKIVTDRLVSFQEEDKPLYVEPLGKLVYWYYTNFDMTHTDTIKDCKSIKFEEVCDKFVKINNSYSSIVVMREVMQAYADYYKINHRVNMADIIKMSKILEQVGLGV